MENKKNKKKLFAIIGASALAFVLTIALSVSITLAYFGGTASGTSKVTLGAAVSVGTSQETSQTIDNALPGQKLGITANATVAQSTTKSFLMALVKIGGTYTGTNDLFANASEWTKVGEMNEGIAYVYGTAAKLTEIDSSSAAKEIKFYDGGVTLPTTLTNDDATQTLEISVTFIAVQSSIPTDETSKDTNNDGFIDGDVSFTDATEVFKAIKTFSAKTSD